jgi:hypothetical protein
MKGTIVKYDPIIACLGCHVEFHDSCRKPPLVDEADPYVTLTLLDRELLTMKGNTGGASNA